MPNRANVAATFMEHLCECPLHGYSWEERFGSSDAGTCCVECEGVTGEFYVGDRDCSSSEIDVWGEALKGSPYEGCLSGASYTGNMREVFVNSGLFEWHDMSFTAQRGDLYLNESNHTAMCLNDNPDTLGEFCINENGGCYGGERGDQTGAESRIAPYYNFPWDGILHYNGKADGETVSEEEQDDNQPLYDAWTTEYGWLGVMCGKKPVNDPECTDDYSGFKGCWFKGFWTNMPCTLTLMDGTEVEVNTENKEANIFEQPIRGITVHDNSVKTQVQTSDWNWLKEEIGDTDGGSGDDEHPIIAVRMWR